MNLLPTTQARIEALMQEHEIALQEHRTGTFTQRVAARKAMRDAITLALKEQDRDTRHACAEAITLSMPDAPSVAVVDAFNRAHGACINAQAI